MFGFSIKEFFLSVAANVAAANIGGVDMIGYIFGLAILLAWFVNWHRKRVAEGKRGVDSWYFIALSMLVAVCALAAAAYGVGLRSAPGKAATENPKEVVATHIDLGPVATANKSVLVANRYYSAKNKEEVAGFLDKISGTINKTGDEMLLLTEKAINQSPWDRPGENIEPFIQRMDVIITKAAQIHATFYDEMLANEREYRVEMNAILFPQEPFITFQNEAKAFRNGLSVWNQMRDKSEGAERRELMNLVMSSRMSFGHARDLFVRWLSQRQEIINQTRMALHS